MQQESYNLSWSNFSDHLREMMHGMMKSNHLTDVTLVSDDKKPLAAHKLVLSACSPVFTRLINYLPQTRAVIYLKGIKHEEMEAVLEFMYIGATRVKQDRINDFLEVAKSLEMKEINNIPQNENNSSRNSKNNEIPPSIDQALIEGIMENSLVNFNLDYLITEERKFSNNPSSRFTNETNKSFKIRKTEVASPKQNEDTRIFPNPQSLRVKKIEISPPKQNDNDDGFACNLCNYKFKYNKDLTKHILSMHQGVILSCTQCDFQTKYKSTLTKHIQTTHKESMIEIQL